MALQASTRTPELACEASDFESNAIIHVNALIISNLPYYGLLKVLPTDCANPPLGVRH